MTREEALQILRKHEPELRARGVMHAALFGSVARGDAGPESDVDVAVQFDPAAPVTLWSYAGLKRRVAELLRSSRRIDVIDLEGLPVTVRSSVEHDAIYAF